jgi:hypothetical protein
LIAAAAAQLGDELIARARGGLGRRSGRGARTPARSFLLTGAEHEQGTSEQPATEVAQCAQAGASLDFNHFFFSKVGDDSIEQRTKTRAP